MAEDDGGANRCCFCWCVADNGVMVMQWWPAR